MRPSSPSDAENDARWNVANTPDFILLKNFDNSAESLIAKYPQGAPLRVIARAIGETEEETDLILQSALRKLYHSCS